MDLKCLSAVKQYKADGVKRGQSQQYFVLFYCTNGQNINYTIHSSVKYALLLEVSVKSIDLTLLCENSICIKYVSGNSRACQCSVQATVGVIADYP